MENTECERKENGHRFLTFCMAMMAMFPHKEVRKYTLGHHQMVKTHYIVVND